MEHSFQNWLLAASGFPLQINGGNASGSFAGLQRPNWNGKDATLSGKMTDRLLRAVLALRDCRRAA